VHLKTGQEYPERYNALKDMLDVLVKDDIHILIIAGDLFDIGSQNYSVFDELCRDKKYAGIDFYVIPGNHDAAIGPKYFTAGNIKIYDEPELVSIGGFAPGFFFVPYLAGKSMGEVIAKHKAYLPDRWVLIGHGDYLSGTRDPNNYESGVYMPLGRSDIEYYDPSRVILGHIHKKMETGKVRYPGSPCGMDINETGRRSFIIFDTDDLSITEKKVNTDYLFFIENLLALPTPNEFEDIKNKIEGFVEGWDLSKEEILKARVRLKVKGYTSDKKKLETTIMGAAADFKFYNDEGPDLSEVSIFNDLERVSIVERVKSKVESLGEDYGYPQQRRDLILEQALGIILKE
jgi:DNA repair exonuclease SbcCD nuclease subunit